MPIPTGAIAPDFTLKRKTDAGLVDVALSAELAAGPVALLFFPAAFTSVCTEELCDRASGLGEFEGRAFGISVDSPFAQAAWAQQAGIDIPLLSDYAHRVVRAYDVELPDLAGLGPSAARAVVVVGRDGLVKYVEQTASPGDLPDFAKAKAALATA